jgi:hypothetical protein
MRVRHIRIALYRPVQPSDRFLIAAAVQFGGSDEVHPPPCASVARADAQRFDDLPLGLLVAAQQQLRQTNERVGGGQISVDCQRPLALRSLGRRDC